MKPTQRKSLVSIPCVPSGIVRHATTWAAGVLAVFLWLVVPAGAQTSWNWVAFDPPPGIAYRGDSWGTAINYFKSIAGGYTDFNLSNQGLVWGSSGNSRPFQVPGSIATYPYSINYYGALAGTYYVGSNFPHGFVRSPQASITIADFPGGTQTYINGINDQGALAGSTQTDHLHPFLATPQ